MRCVTLLLLCATFVRADGPKDNIPDNVRKVPPPGIKLSDQDRKELAEELKKLQYALAVLEEKIKPEARPYLPDVEIYEKAVRYALEYDEFFNVKEVAIAKSQLKTGLERADALLKGQHPWTRQTGQVIRGYRSKIDGSVQPYGLCIPKDYDFQKPIRLDFWCHGRGETLSEVNFIQSCQNPPQFATDKAIVLSLYGRYCCANKLAGEVDCFEALEHAKKDYKIDENRLVMRGFSMGGAAAWHFAAHYPSMWCAAAPGAGFSETPDFLKVFQNEDVSKIPAWEKKLWHMYDCTDFALNFYNLPTVAYSGEIDNQKQAADIMEKAMKKEGLDLVHIIGPKTGHSYEKGAKAEVIKQIDAIADKGRNPVPEKIKFVTYTLRYNRCYWVMITGLEEHWQRAEVEAETADRDRIILKTKNVNRLLLDMMNVKAPFDPGRQIRLEIDGQAIGKENTVTLKGNFRASLVKEDGKWSVIFPNVDKELSVRKSPGLKGPIDDAFLDSFIMVRPTGKPNDLKSNEWVEAEMNHAIKHWRQQFRGDAPVKDDRKVTEDDIKNNNLILWGESSSNSVIAKIYDKLPVTWKDGKLVTGSQSFDMATHMPILIYPNPLNPKKYVVLNSGFTFREYDYLNNARQIPKLPDWAIVDITTPPNSRYPGKIVAADFFDEQWKVKPAKK
jgi:Prolyl oligopeptidase family